MHNPSSPKLSKFSPPIGITIRSLVLGACLIPFNAYWVIWQERVMLGPYPSTISLFANVIFCIFILRGINALLGRVAPRLQLGQGEVMVLYAMLAISTGLAGLDGFSTLSEMIPYAAWYGKGGALPYAGSFPSWLVVTSRAIVKGHYIGHSSFYQPVVLRAWAVPILAWTAFITCLLGVAQCINVLIRAQWADHEHLTFPITWLPMSMTEDPSPEGFYSNKLMWIGFGIAFALNLWNGIAFLVPSVPGLSVAGIDLKPLLTTHPWNAIDWMPVTFYPVAIGICFLLPLDLLFSCWFFYLFWKGQMVLSSAMGWDATAHFPYIREQGFGSIIGLFCLYLWTGRRTYASILKRAWRSLRHGDPEAAQQVKEEGISQRGALSGILLGVTCLILFMHAAGVQWWAAGVFLLVLLAIMLVVTRVRAELGSPVHDFHFMGPDAMMPRLLSTGPFRGGDLAFFTFGYAFTRAHRSDTMPVGLESMQMAHQRGLDARRMLYAVLIATVVGAVCALGAFEQLAYQFGAASKFASGTGMAVESFTRMNGWTSHTLNNRLSPAADIAAAVGFLVTILMAAVRLRFINFPLSPLGYALSSSWAINLVWMPMFIAWVVKGLITRYGGLGMYRRAVPFFLGIVLGDCVMGSAWALIGLVLHVHTYNFFGA